MEELEINFNYPLQVVAVVRTESDRIFKVNKAILFESITSVENAVDLNKDNGLAVDRCVIDTTSHGRVQICTSYDDMLELWCQYKNWARENQGIYIKRLSN
jgi:hypothetical protein